MDGSCDFTFDPHVLDGETRRHWRSQLRGTAEEFAHDLDDTDGVITHLVVIAEFASSNYEEQWDHGAEPTPERALWCDYSDHSGWTDVPWTVKGLLTEVLDQLKGETE